MKKSKLPPLISLEYLINEVKKQEQKEEITRIVAIIFSFIGVFYFFIKLLFL